MTIYEIRTDPMAERGYFIPQEPANIHYRFCETCHFTLEPLGGTQIVKWNGGEDPGDFVMGGVGTCAKRSVGEELREQFRDLRLTDISVVNRSRSGEKKRRYDYTGEDIVHLTSDLVIPFDPDRCTLVKDKRTFIPCPTCGRTNGSLDGVEMRPTPYYIPSKRTPNYKRRVARQPGKGAFLFADELQDHDFFFLGSPLHLHCSEKAREFIVRRGYQNVDLAEVGVTIRRGDPVPIRFDGSAPKGYRPPVDQEFKVVHARFKVLGVDVPRDIEEIKKLQFDIPHLSPDSPKSCPVSMHEIRAYLKVEAVGDEFNLDWCRTALIEDAKYWLWRMADDGRDTYVFVEQRNSMRTIGVNDALGTSPDQFLVHEFLRGK